MTVRVSTQIPYAAAVVLRNAARASGIPVSRLVAREVSSLLADQAPWPAPPRPPGPAVWLSLSLDHEILHRLRRELRERRLTMVSLLLLIAHRHTAPAASVDPVEGTRRSLVRSAEDAVRHNERWAQFLRAAAADETVVAFLTTHISPIDDDALWPLVVQQIILASEQHQQNPTLPVAALVVRAVLVAWLLRREQRRNFSADLAGALIRRLRDAQSTKDPGVHEIAAVVAGVLARRQGLDLLAASLLVVTASDLPSDAITALRELPPPRWSVIRGVLTASEGAAMMLREHRRPDAYVTWIDSWIRRLVRLACDLA